MPLYLGFSAADFPEADLAPVVAFDFDLVWANVEVAAQSTKQIAQASTWRKAFMGGSYPCNFSGSIIRPSGATHNVTLPPTALTGVRLLSQGHERVQAVITQIQSQPHDHSGQDGHEPWIADANIGCGRAAKITRHQDRAQHGRAR